MTHQDAVALLKNVPIPGETWADLGAGSGTFTHALSELLGPGGSVLAVDRNANALRHIGSASPDGAVIETLHADFAEALTLPPLDGLLLANSLHFVRQQVPVLRHLAGFLKPGGKAVFLEYDAPRASPWNPYPLPFARLSQVAAASGLGELQELSRRPSAFGGRELYLAVAVKPGAFV